MINLSDLIQMMKDLSPVAAWLALIVTFVNVVVNYRQNKFKNRSDLYERRKEIFDVAINLIDLCNKSAKIDDNVLSDFSNHTREAAFLFGKEINFYIEDLRRNAGLLSSSREGLQRIRENPPEFPPDNKWIIKLADDSTDLTKWFQLQPYEARNKFKKYLRVD